MYQDVLLRGSLLDKSIGYLSRIIITTSFSIRLVTGLMLHKLRKNIGI